jgi:parallel beta-helix repeat protein
MGLSLPVRSAEDTYFGLKVYRMGYEYNEIILVFLISWIPIIISLVRNKIKEPKTLFSLSIIVPILSLILITPLMVSERYDNRHYQMAYGMYVIILGILIQFIVILFAIFHVSSPTSTTPPTSTSPQKKNQSAFIMVLLNTMVAFLLLFYTYSLWFVIGYLLVSITVILLLGTILLGMGKNKIGAVFCLIGGILTIPIGLLGVYAAQKAWKRSTKGNRVATVAVITIVLLSLIAIYSPQLSDDVLESKEGPRTIYVNNTGSGGAYTKITDAINDSEEGDTVFVYGGNYTDDIYIEKSINLFGEDNGTTFINGIDRRTVIGISRSNYVNITGFSIIGDIFDEDSSNSAISLYESHNCIIKNNIISNTQYGIQVSGSSKIDIINNNISRIGEGIVIYNNNGHQIKNNSISFSINGIKFRFTDHNNITGNTISNNEYGIKVGEPRDGYHNVSNNIIDHNVYGIKFTRSSYNTLSLNRISNNEDVGLYLASSSHNQIHDNEITLNEVGIKTREGSHLNISSNNISDNIVTGIQCEKTQDNDFKNNFFYNNSFYAVDLSACQRATFKNNIMMGSGLSVSGSKTVNWDSHDIDNSNTVNGKPIIYWNNIYGRTVPSEVGQVFLVNCRNIKIENQHFVSSSVAIGIIFSEDITIYNNTIMENQYGIRISNSIDCSIDKNIISSNERAVAIGSSDGTYIGNNIVTLSRSRGIDVGSSHNGTITANNLSYNSCAALYFSSKDNNILIYHNNFIDNKIQARDSGESNRWNASYPQGGNYWSDYDGVDLNSTASQDTPPPDGIGDTPYMIDDHFADSSNQDNYPLMNMYE